MFSVIVPVYNTADYVEACIQSLLDQDQPDFEIIAVDDGSTDNSAQILTGIAERHKRLRVHRTENAGQGAARHCGLSKARGIFVAFVDSDDGGATELFSRTAQHLSDRKGVVKGKSWTVSRDIGARRIIDKKKNH